MKLPYGSNEYKQVHHDEVEKSCNGCGVIGRHGLLDWIMGINVRPACCQHDYEYTNKTLRREVSDWYFYQNLLYLIDRSDKGDFRKFLARQIAWIYYHAVRKFGGIFTAY